MPIFSEQTTELLRLKKRTPGNIVLLVLYQALAVWPVVVAFGLIYLAEPEVFFTKIVIDIFLGVDIVLEEYLVNILTTITLTVMLLIGLLYTIIVPIVEARSFPKTTNSGAKLLLIFLLNFFIVFFLGGVDSARESFIAYGIINFMSFFLMFGMVYGRSMSTIFSDILEKLQKRSFQKAIESFTSFVFLFTILVVSFVMTFLIGINILKADSFGSIYYIIAIIFLAIMIYKKTELLGEQLDRSVKQRDYELTGRRGPRKL
jgi:hypothetical protein